MACQEDYYTGEDLKAIVEATDEKIWDKNVEFTAEVGVSIREIEEPSKSGFECEKL